MKKKQNQSKRFVKFQYRNSLLSLQNPIPHSGPPGYPNARTFTRAKTKRTVLSKGCEYPNNRTFAQSLQDL